MARSSAVTDGLQVHQQVGNRRGPRLRGAMNQLTPPEDLAGLVVVREPLIVLHDRGRIGVLVAPAQAGFEQPGTSAHRRVSETDSGMIGPSLAGFSCADNISRRR